MKWTFIYGAAEYDPVLLNDVRAMVIKASPLVSQNCGIVLLDRYGIEAEAMRTCEMFKITYHVIGSSIRSSAGASSRVYERAIMPKLARREREITLINYAMRKANGVVVIGNDPSCRAVCSFAKALKKDLQHIPTPLPPVRIPAPDTDWIRQNGYWYIQV